jgi:hypothetical protein
LGVTKNNSGEIACWNEDILAGFFAINDIINALVALHLGISDIL